MTDTEALHAVVARLTRAERDAIVERFTNANPHYRGAEVGDVLEALADGDANLELREPFWEAHPQLWDGPEATYAALALIWAGQKLTEAGINRLAPA